MLLRLADFVSSGDGEYADSLRCLPAFPASVTACLLCGPRGCGKTTLLLQYAWTMARRGTPVLCLLRRDKVEQHCPAPSAQSGDEREAMGRIRLKYVDSMDALLQFASCSHLGGLLDVGAILVDDLSEILGSSHCVAAELAMVLAYLLDTANQLKRQASGDACMLVVTELAAEAQRNFFVYRHWLPIVLSIVPDGAEFRLGLHPTAKSSGGLSTADLQHTQISYQLQHSEAQVCGIRTAE